MPWAHDKKRAKSRKKETRLCVRRTFVNIITQTIRKSYKKSVKKFGTFFGNCGILYLYIRFIENKYFLYRKDGEGMTILEIKEILGARVLSGEEWLDKEVHTACGSDMMSDVLAFVKDQAVLLTGLCNPQVIRTAEMMDSVCIVFVRNKKPDEEMIRLANEREIPLLATGHRMFSACGILYEKGLRGGTDYERYD